jgi:peptidyl-prolyl cis-trans isomerase B (cyclophilin B)
MAVLLTTNHGDIKIELDAGKRRRPLPTSWPTSSRPLQRHHLPPRHRRLHDPGRRLRTRHEAEGNQRPIENEANNGLKNEPYTLAMARTAAPHSATAQFFINVKNNSFLDFPGQDGWGYCVFGKVVEGTEVVDKIKGVKTTRAGMFADVPAEDVVIEKAEVV